MGEHATVAEALDAGLARASVPVTRPKVVREAGGLRVVVPGDPGYDDAEEVEASVFPPGHDASPTGDVRDMRPGGPSAGS